MRFCYFLGILLPIACAASDVSIAVSSVETATVERACPVTVKEWKGEREKAVKATSLVDVLAFGERVRGCFAEPKLKKKISREPLGRALIDCLVPLGELTSLAVEDSGGKTPLESLIRLKLLPAAAFALPTRFKDERFWSQIASGDRPAIERALSKLEKDIPGSVVLEYTSFLQPKSPLVLVVFDEKTTGLRRFVHFDYDMNVNVLSIPLENAEKAQALGSIPREVLLDASGKVRSAALASALDTSHGRCFRCHQSAAIAIVPKEGTKVRWFTSSMKSREGALEWFNREYMTATDTGYAALLSKFPSFGAVAKEDLPSVAERCFPAAGPRKQAIYREALSCTSCHDGLAAPLMKFPFGNAGFFTQGASVSSIDLDHRIHEELGVPVTVEGTLALPQHFVRGGHMPLDLGSQLSGEEREAVFDCLAGYYLGRFYSRSPEPFKKEEGLLMKSLFESRACRSVTSGTSR